VQLFQLGWWAFRLLLMRRVAIAIENLALRQQLAVTMRSTRRVKLRKCDRIFWGVLAHWWKDWRSCLVMVQPETVCRWHRLGFRLFWRWKSTWEKRGRPKVDAELRILIRRMSRENPLWGAPRIRDELFLLGHALAKSTVAKYMVRSRKPPSSTWKTFLKNHAPGIAACDFFVIPTVTFRLLYCFVILSHDRRRVIHFNVTSHPTAQWTAQQVVEAFPFEEAPRYLLRDNDSIYGKAFQERVASLGIEELKTAYRSPWQNAYVERLIGSIRRECLDQTIVLGERHLCRVLAEYFEYYNKHRAHQGLDGDSPVGRNKEPPELGEVVAVPFLGGLHHRYTRRKVA